MDMTVCRTIVKVCLCVDVDLSLSLSLSLSVCLFVSLCVCMIRVCVCLFVCDTMAHQLHTNKHTRTQTMSIRSEGLV